MNKPAMASSAKKAVSSRFSTASINKNSAADEEKNTSPDVQPSDKDKGALPQRMLPKPKSARRSSMSSVSARYRRCSVESTASTVIMQNGSKENRSHSAPDISSTIGYIKVYKTMNRTGVRSNEEEGVAPRDASQGESAVLGSLGWPKKRAVYRGRDTKTSENNQTGIERSARRSSSGNINVSNLLESKTARRSSLGDIRSSSLSERKKSSEVRSRSADAEYEEFIRVLASTSKRKSPSSGDENDSTPGSLTGSLTGAEYEEFVSRKISSQAKSGGMTYTERKRQHQSDGYDSCGSSIGSESGSVGGRPRSVTSEYSSNAARFKRSAAGDTQNVARARHESNIDEDGSLSSASRFKYGTNSFSSSRHQSGESQILDAEVKVSPPLCEEEKKEEVLSSDDEESMISAVEAAWRAGAEVRQSRFGSKIFASMSSNGEDFEESLQSIRATLVVEEEPVREIMPVEAIPIDEEERKRQLKKQIILVYIPLSLFVIIAVVLVVVGLSTRGSLESDGDAKMYVSTPAVHQPTLVQVKTEGVLRCGVPGDNGFSGLNNLTGEREGMVVDLCKAVAAYVLGSEYRTELIVVDHTTRFTALAGRDIDLLMYGDTHTMERDFHEKATGVGFQFSDPYLYDGLRFAGVPHAVKCADNYDWFGDCSDLKICVFAGSTHEDVLRQNFPRQKLIRKDDQHSYLQGFVGGSCSVLAGEQNDIVHTGVRNAGYEGDYAYGKKTLSKEPLAMVTRKDEQSWSDIVNWVLRALIYAEKNSVTQNNARTELHDHRFVAALEAVGNYGEIWARHMEKEVPRKGMNLLYTKETNSGIHYSHPFGVIEDFRHEFDPSGTANQVVERGRLTCGVFGSKDQSIDTDYCRALAASLFDGDYNLVDFIELSNDDNLLERLDNGEMDVVAGANLTFHEDMVPSNETASGVSGLAFSKPYFYDENDSVSKTMATSQRDADWSSFVYWVVMSTIWAEENGVTSNDFREAPEVELFGPRFGWMFKGTIIGRGNYAEIYHRNAAALPLRANRNLINNGSTPQLCPPEINEISLK